MRSKLGGELMRAVSRFAIVGVVGGMTAACSTERFAGGNPLSNPFASGSPEPVRTGSISPEQAPAMPRSTVDSQPLAPIRPVPGAAPSYPSAAAPAPTYTQPRTASGAAGWSTAGGTTVIVGPGETLTTLTSRYGVPAEAILSANGLKATDVAAGRRVVIPVYSATGEGAPARRAEAPVHYNTPAAPAPGRVVASQKIEVKAQPPRTLVEAAPPKSQLRPGQKVATVVEKVPAKVAERVPAPAPARTAVRVIETTPAAQKVQAAAPAPAPKVAAKPEPKKIEAKVARAEPKPVEKEILLPARKVVAKADSKPAAPAPKEAPQKVVAAAKVVEPVKAPAKEPETTASISPAPAPAAPSGGSDFRWPARGRVINGFGGGGGNEGINIAVPEGTPVKAAGDGVVAYAGSEVKGYGNLVLIRHDNGYVSAYANNGQLDVKRGQRVSRGHTIAKSGQTGNVTSPQLHFEIRKGSTPVDPMKYLASAE